MRRTIISLMCCAAIMVFVAAQITNASNKSDVNNVSDDLIAMEKAALVRFNNGDPSGYLENCANEITYFDETTAARVDGYDALKKLYEPIKGQVHNARFEMVNPKVQLYGDVGVLTFNLITYSNEGKVTSHWNSTEVYSKIDDAWKIIHSHWSFTKQEEKD
ncbi:MAG: YybH family protein [Planctomycetota bacterium]|jgi:ketosteroid isomerase-like protein